MRSITYSAPGKIFISGEHAVVYGKPALVTAVNKRLAFTLYVQDHNSLPANKSHEGVAHIKSVVQDYLKKHNLRLSNTPFIYHITSDIPVRSGMGSSAALCVSAVAAFLHWYTGKAYNKEIINSLAHTAEHYFHGKSSGVDVSAATYGGLIYYRKEFEFLKNISSLHMKIPQVIQQTLILINSGKPKESTKQMVTQVGKLFNTQPKKTERILQLLEKCTKRLTLAISQERLSFFRESLLKNHQALVKLGVVSKETQQLLQTLKPFGAGKIAGAGGNQHGSGYVLFSSDRISELQKKLDSMDINYLSFEPSTEGVRKEE
ncbi:mevalonate kinase [Candidatus Woesebacteria bacterium]|nr:mevalonate kinase [Candidatus Woesebacteria bacterium]